MNDNLITPPAAYADTAWAQIIANSGYWFSKSTMAFFKSRILWATLTHDSGEAYLFVTSEDTSMPYYPAEPRLYTLRRYSDEGISTIGAFREFATRDQAVAALNRYLKGVEA